MTGTKILWGQMLGALLAVLVGLWGATEWTAWFQPALGLPWVQLAGFPVYRPELFFIWWYRFDAYAPLVFLEGAMLGAAGGFGAMVVAVAGSVLRAQQGNRVTTYGSARWAAVEEIRAAGLTGPAGVLLGRWGRHLLRHDGPEHVLAFAPTRSGKGVGLVVPTLLTWIGSTIVHDLKGEKENRVRYDTETAEHGK
jgi:type IV secretion system protein VirD4